MGFWLVLSLLAALLTWGYGDSLAPLAISWHSPPYCQNWLVPLVAFATLILRRRSPGPVSAPARWAGVAMLASALAVRLGASLGGLPNLEMLSFVPALASLWLIAGGWPAFRAGAPAVALLCLMLPLPWAAENAILDRAQGLATASSTFALQTLGVDAYREGNVIFVGRAPDGAVGASSRIRAAGLILAMAAALALVARRPWWERFVILLSGPLILVAVNVARLTLAGLLRWGDRPGAADFALRDRGSAGMLLLAALLLAAEYFVLSRLYREAPRPAPAGPEVDP